MCVRDAMLGMCRHGFSQKKVTVNLHTISMTPNDSHIF